MKSLLLAIIAVPGSFAYVVSAPGAVSNPTFLPPPITALMKSCSRASYDLGLGKNLPLSGGRKLPNDLLNTYDAVQFWMEDEAVNTYPSPVMKPVEPRKPQPIVPVRLGKDLVHIAGDSDKATAVLRVKSVELDMNTLWVEMFIHDQQRTLVLSDSVKAIPR